jgi:hypothetical protein
MSEATLTSLLEYLYGALTPNNQRWLAAHLVEHADKEEAEAIKPYTIEELHERIAQSERDFAEGRYFTDEEVFADLDEYGWFIALRTTPSISRISGTPAASPKNKPNN